MQPRYKVFDCNMLYLHAASSRSGTITTVENLKEIPFEIARAYYLYDIPGGANRGGHAHKQLEHFIIAVAGSFDILLDDGINKKTVHMNRANLGLYLRSGIWREISNFSSGAICLALASRKYEESDYIREYNDFKVSYGNN